MNVKLMRVLWLFCALAIVPIHDASGQMRNLWSSPNELASKPTEGPAWDAVREAANQVMLDFDISEHLSNDRTNVNVLAAAIVAARTGDPIYIDRVTNGIESLVAKGAPGGNTLAWARQAGSYVLAADLIDYRTNDFDLWLGNLASEWTGTDNRTLRRMFEQRPNNWGSHAFGTLSAIYAYLNDTENLAEIRDYWIQGVTGPNPGYKYGTDLSWHLDEQNPLLINPEGATKDGVVIDGFIPDDMRRGGSFAALPGFTNYVWESQQGLMMAARVLDRVDMPIWDVADNALYRVANAYHVRLGGVFAAENDDLWLLPFYDEAYGTNWAEGQKDEVWKAGKNVGFAYVLGGTPQSILGDFDNNGVLDVSDIDALSAAVRTGSNDHKFDVNADGSINAADRQTWVVSLKNTYFGDSNLDGQFDSQDFVAVFTAAQYEDTIDGNSTWGTGDWDGDTDFTTGDLVLAFTENGYERGERPATLAVPEPPGILLLVVVMGMLGIRRRVKL